MRLDGLTAGYSGRAVLEGLSATIHAGEWVALLGPNGSGKSTLLRAMAGQISPMAGSVKLAGRDLRAYTPRERAMDMAYFPQSRPVPRMEVATLVAHGRFPRLGPGRRMGADDRAAVSRALAQTGLAGMEARPLATLSGGERQRAYLAMLIAQETRVLLLDEPGSFLDIGHQLEIMDILRGINGQGKTVVFAAHDLPLACTYARRVMVLEGGRIVADGPPSEVAAGSVLGRVFGVRLAGQTDENALFRYHLEHHNGADHP